MQQHPLPAACDRLLLRHRGLSRLSPGCSRRLQIVPALHREDGSSYPTRGRSPVRADDRRNAARGLPRVDVPIDCMGGEGDLSVKVLEAFEVLAERSWGSAAPLTMNDMPHQLASMLSLAVFLTAPPLAFAVRSPFPL